MFDLEKAIRQWLKSFRKHRSFEDGAVWEMELHIRDHIEDLQAKGMSDEEAFLQATKSFGDIPKVASEEIQLPTSTFQSLLHFTMVGNYLKIARRSFFKNRFYSFVNLMGLTIGLTVVFLIGLFVYDELNFDSFHEKKDRLYRVVENQYYSDQPVFPVAVTPTALGPGLQADFPEIVNYVRITGEVRTFKVGDQQFQERDGAMADPAFFEMFSFPMVKGSAREFGKQLNNLIINEELADKYFREDDPINQTIILDDEEYVVVGVMKNIPPNSHLNYDFVINFEKFLAGDPARASRWGSNWLYTYVELQPGTDAHELSAKIKNKIKDNLEESETEIYLQPMLDIYLGEVDFVVEVARKGQMQYVRIFSIVALFILVISCINFMNLSTARSMKRAKEVGLRKTIGATRLQLVYQFLGESILLATIAVVLSGTLVYLILPQFNLIVNKEFAFDPLQNLELTAGLAVGVFGFAIITGILAGIYPALFLSGMEASHVLKAEKAAKGGMLRKGLVVFQFTISVVLIIGTLVVYQQLSFIQNKNLGYNKDNLLYIYPHENKEAFAAELREDPAIVAAGTSTNHPAYVFNSSSGFRWKGKDPDSKILIHNMGMDEYYFQTLGYQLKQGRTFKYNDSLSILINEEAARLMGFADPVGELVQAGDNDELTIIGVVEDFHFKSIHTPIEPLIIYYNNESSRLFVRLANNDLATGLEVIEAKWNKFYPDEAFNFKFLDEDFEFMYKSESRTGQVATYFAILAIFISCMGLFGLVSYAAEQRTKEVGIRKVLGASVQNLFLLLTTDFTVLVIVSLLISIPVGWFAMNTWLQSFAYHIDLSIWVFILAALAALLIAILTVSYQSIRVSVGNPVKALRNE